MLIQRYPRSAWSWRATAAVTAVIVTPLLGMLLLAPELRNFETMVTTTQLVIYPAILGAGILLYTQFRLTESEVLGWVTMCLTLYAVECATLAGLRAGDPELFFNRPGWVLAVDLPVALLILVAIRSADHTSFRVDPLVAGLLFGLVVAGFRVTANTFGTELAMTSRPVIAVEVLLVVVGIAIAHAAARLRGIPPWSAGRLGLGTVALVANHIASVQDGGNPVVGSIALVSGVVGAVFLIGASGAGLRFVIQQQVGSLTTLAEHVAEMEAEERESRARLHEITNSIAGIAVASSLIHSNSDVSAPKRHKLEEMVEAESNRLARVLGRAGRDHTPSSADNGQASSPDTKQRVELDEVICPLVTAHRTLGLRVQWHPGGLAAIADPDAVAEVVNILLDNAARHAPDSCVSIEVTSLGDTVEIAVRDNGPGIPAGMRQQLFEWGERGPESNGQGIGLHVAHRLMTSGGNSLRLDDDGAGARFVIRLQAAGLGRS